MALLARHACENCAEAGHLCLARVGRGTVSKILRASNVKPHRIVYYLERRDSAFAEKRASVLALYQEVELLRQQDMDRQAVVVSYDEKPGIQAIEVLAADLPPIPGTHPAVAVSMRGRTETSS